MAKHMHQVQPPKEEDNVIKIKNKKRNWLHYDVVHNSTGTGVHKSKKTYSRKEKHKNKPLY